jgi:diketogulonate reductase-like aldo/keto reductase
MADEIGFFQLNTGAKIPSVGLGTWQAAPGVVGDAVAAAVKIGYQHIDCASRYGNEIEIGKVLKKLFDDGVVKREKLFITSKIWYFVHEVSASLSFLCIFSFPRLLKPLNLLKSTNYASTG